jgi:hypothetical protein
LRPFLVFTVGFVPGLLGRRSGSPVRRRPVSSGPIQRTIQGSASGIPGLGRKLGKGREFRQITLFLISL